MVRLMSEQGRCGLEAMAPSTWVVRWAGLIEPGAQVLDFAGGPGRNLAPLLERGARVTIVDRNPGALASADPRAQRLCADLESGPWAFGAQRFDAVVCCNYLFRPRLDLLLGLVKPAGVLIYETFARGNERFGRPARPEFLLRRGELFEAAVRCGLEVLAFEDGYVDLPRPAMIQRVCALRPPAVRQERRRVG